MHEEPISLKRGLAAAILPLSLSVTSALAVPVPGGSLDPTTIPKYVTPLVIPPVLYADNGAPLDASVALRQITQQVLPTTGCSDASAVRVAAGLLPIPCAGDAFPLTPLWAYGDPADPTSFNNPAFTFEVTKDTLTRVNWINDLTDPATGQFLTHIIRDSSGNPIIDQTLHWANPGQDCIDGVAETDCRGNSDAPYMGPVPMVTHVHGAHVGPVSDGYPEAWWLPKASNILCADPVMDSGQYDCGGTFYDDMAGTPVGAGHAVYEYTNDQPSTTLWYHDHSLGMTRLNVYAAGAGFWLIRDPAWLLANPTAGSPETGLLSGTLPGPATALGQDPNGDPAIRAAIREIPVAIQPKSFNFDGAQFYPSDRAFFEGLGTGQLFGGNSSLDIPFLPKPISDISPVWNPEAFFNTMVVNGSTWPILQVAPERYRLRLLNAADSRFLNLSLMQVTETLEKLRELPFYQIGAEQSLLPQVVRIESGYATPLPGDGSDVDWNNPTCIDANGNLVKDCVVPQPGTSADQALLMGPAERADVIVDFSGLNEGDLVVIFNTGPDAPFGGFPDTPADSGTTGQVMIFQVNSALNNPLGDPSTPAASLVLSTDPGGEPKLGPSSVTRDLALLEEESAQLCVFVDAVSGVVTLDENTLPPTCDPALGSLPFAPMAAVLGTFGSTGGQVQMWDDPIAQNPAPGATETWELWNWSADAHPIHLHLVKFEVVDREVMGGAVRMPEPWETGWKDTVIAYPGEITRVKALFDKVGLYVWHCHILSHEDNEMMVPFCVGDTLTDCAGL
ncbi:MAG: multicopper oxidase domain-containing protein [Pseudomonadota bacterium]